MILGQVSFLDCFVFLLFLTPQLILKAGLLSTLACVINALPFFLIGLPCSFVYERYFLRPENQNLFVQQASVFEDIVVRCVRYAFAKIPASIGRVFFSKEVAIPFLRFRMLRHGYIKSPIHYEDINKNNAKGIWMIKDPSSPPSIILYYAHGGGFSMGSPHFYLEFLLTLLTHLTSPTHPNPAIFALKYTLVPTSSYPTQLQEALNGYQYLLPLISNNSSKICLAGDSAGGTIMLSLLLLLSSKKMEMPGAASLISPWTTLYSKLHINTAEDFLDVDALNLYGRQYLSSSTSSKSPPSPTKIIPAIFASPGEADPSIWHTALPRKGLQIIYGSCEVFAPEIEKFVSKLRKGNGAGKEEARGDVREKIRIGDREVELEVIKEKGGIHAWVVASLFLSSTKEERTKGIRWMAEWIRGVM